MICQLFRLTVLICVAFTFARCSGKPSLLPPIDEKTFNDYWSQRKAEISSYDLNQSLNGTSRTGKAVLIFVTEDMSKSKQVRLDNPAQHSSDDIKVMKLNVNKEFVTGINKYSMMSSIFTPINDADYPHSLKLAVSSQDWAGQFFSQFNWKGNRYEVQQLSYLESEGDKSFSLVNAWLEDEIMTKIRVAPNTLPIGNITMIPSAFYFHISNQPDKVYDAIASLVPEGDHYHYTIQYPELKRTMEINFQNSFPYKILGWKETYGNNEITTGQLSNTILSDFWNHDHPEDEILREELKLK